MRHHNTNRKFGRLRNQRKALLRSLALSLVAHEKIKTTEAKAKELRPYIEKLITRGKDNCLFARRLLIARLGNDTLAGNKIVNEIAVRYKERKGGYTRITKLPRRAGDASPMAIIEFIQKNNEQSEYIFLNPLTRFAKSH